MKKRVKLAFKVAWMTILELVGGKVISDFGMIPFMTLFINTIASCNLTAFSFQYEFSSTINVGGIRRFLFDRDWLNFLHGNLLSAFIAFK